MKIIECEQGGPEWLMARAGIVTASELDSLISPLWKIRTGQGPHSYLAAKLAERWLGGNISQFASFDMEQGKILEREARDAMAFELNCDIREVGLVTTDDGKFGASPDGLIGEVGIEIKCPKPETHVKTLLDGEIPSDHLAQIHGGLYATGAAEWIFCSYRRKFPPFVVRVKRDEAIQEKIHEAVSAFNELLDEAMRTLEGLNGGPSPVKREYQLRPFAKPAKPSMELTSSH